MTVFLHLSAVDSLDVWTLHNSFLCQKKKLDTNFLATPPATVRPSPKLFPSAARYTSWCPLSPSNIDVGMFDLVSFNNTACVSMIFQPSLARKLRNFPRHHMRSDSCRLSTNHTRDIHNTKAAVVRFISSMECRSWRSIVPVHIFSIWSELRPMLFQCRSSDDTATTPCVDGRSGCSVQQKTSLRVVRLILLQWSSMRRPLLVEALDFLQYLVEAFSC